MEVQSMLQRCLVLLFAGVISTVGPVYAAETYEIDNSHSQIGFSVKHLTVANVKGDFKTYSGTIIYDDKDINKSSVNVVIESKSIDTANVKRDEHLRGKDFFEVEKFPQVTFASKRIQKRGKAFIAVGDLTMHGITKEVEIPFTLSGPVADPWQGNKHLGIEGGLTIDRQEWGVSWNDKLDKGGLVVGNDVRINLEVEAILKPEPKAEPAKVETKAKETPKKK
jgi:polyisoprenoid-binding protein YceI